MRRLTPYFSMARGATAVRICCYLFEVTQVGVLSLAALCWTVCDAVKG
jgi:hypothetical protein